MKKRLIIFSIWLTATATASGQEAFRHLSTGLDLGSTGIGLELALPIVNNHLVLIGGYNWGNFSTSVQPTKDLDTAPFINAVNRYITQANQHLEKAGDTRRLEEMPYLKTVGVNGKLGFGTAKAILEYYPAKKNGFHINAGVYIGGQDVLNADFLLQDLWNAYSSIRNAATNLMKEYPEIEKHIGEFPDAKATFKGKTYRLTESGILNVGVNAAKVRPYLGMGFGRSIPKTRFGFQCDLGAIYTGRVAVSSVNEVNETSEISITSSKLEGIIDKTESIRFYPQLSFRLIFRIF